MSRIQLTRIIPITDQILLIAFKDTELEKYDVKLMLHQIDGIHPRTNPDHFRTFLHENEQIISEWECQIGGVAPEPGEDAVEVTLTMPADELAEVESTCADLNVTVQQLGLAIIRFCVEPDSCEALQQWNEYINKKRPLCPECNQELKHMIALGVPQNNVENLYTCNNCGSSWIISDDNDTSSQIFQRYFGS